MLTIAASRTPGTAPTAVLILTITTPTPTWYVPKKALVPVIFSIVLI